MNQQQTTHQPGQHATRDKDATRQRLLDAAEAVFADKGYHGTVVDDIIRASDSSKGGFYFHFPNKQAIFLALIDKLVPKLAAAIDRAIAAETDPIAQLDAALRTVLETFGRHRKLSKILLIEAVGLGHGFDEKLMRTRGRFAGMIQEHLDRAVAAGAIAPQDTTLVSWAWFGAINEIVVRWLTTGEPERLEDILPPLRTLLLRSVGVVIPAAPSPPEGSAPHDA
ncbi:MAG TPA: TetR/AcrR family transcriptional regulator [Ktedonobacterales bacterium]|nr:TetR/AcrR family transcriptional regulator [Ktedonobacterales bacterium]